MESIENVIQSVQLEGMTQLNDTSSLLAFLKSRRSGSAKAMGAPGPDEQQLQDILSLAVRVPDHGKLTPWRFVLFEGDARAKVGQAFRKRWAELNPGHGEETLAFAADLFTRAPVVVAVVSTASEHPKIPVWEQQLSGAALCFNMVLAARAVGFDATWLTEWVSYDAVTVTAMGVKPAEKLMGLIYIGTASAPLEDRPRPDPLSLLTRWGS